MEIFITQDNQQTGPFTPKEIQAGLAIGKYQSSDLIWYHGIENWIPLSQASGILSPSPSLYPAPTATCGIATASMILGVSSFFFLITAIPAVICGHIARGKIKKSQGTLGGGGLAMAGIITGYLVIGLMVTIAGLAALMTPMIMSQVKNAHRVEALNNAKQIGLALYVFEDEYGTYPNSETAKIVADDTGTPEITGDSSNARFHQLIISGASSGEEIFYAKSGECGFGYIDNIPSNISDPRPIVMTPFISGTTKFDPEPFDGKAIILWTDNSARTYPIDSTTGEVIVDGKSILDPSHPIWAGTPPNLLLPE